jgi:nickel superoxide dismutase
MKETSMNVRDRVQALFTTPVAEAHCDGPCGVYDPASARVTAEAVLSMTKKMLDLHTPQGTDDAAWAAYLNTMSRFAAIKEDQAEKTKHELLVLWTDYFKPDHLEAFPDLHETFWTAAKLCSQTKQNVDVAAAENLMASVEKIHKMFWESKNRDVAWVPAVG